jgi:hypothetical protein
MHYETLVNRLIRLKHGKHDQSSHGRRGGGGGATMGAKPKPSAGQMSLFDVFDAPTSTPTPATTAMPKPSSGFSQQRLSEMHKRIDDAPGLTDAQRKDLKSVATKAAECAERVNARRQEILYPDGQYAGADGLLRNQMRTETRQIAEDFVNEAGRVADAQIQRVTDSVFRQTADTAMLKDVQTFDTLLADSAQLAFLQPTPANVTVDVRAPGDIFSDKPANVPPEMLTSVSSASQSLMQYVHIAPNDGNTVQVNVLERQNLGDSRFNNDTNMVVIGAIIEPSQVKIGAAPVVTHELGHWIDAAKFVPGAITGDRNNDIDAVMASSNWNGNGAAIEYILLDSKMQTYTTSHNGYPPRFKIPYANVIYGGRRRDGTAGPSGSEVTSTTLEYLFGNPGIRAHEMSGSQGTKLRSFVLTDPKAMLHTLSVMHY